jgi:hypothetical protein
MLRNVLIINGTNGIVLFEKEWLSVLEKVCAFVRGQRVAVRASRKKKQDLERSTCWREWRCERRRLVGDAEVETNIWRFIDVSPGAVKTKRGPAGGALGLWLRYGNGVRCSLSRSIVAGSVLHSRSSASVETHPAAAAVAGTGTVAITMVQDEATKVVCSLFHDVTNVRSAHPVDPLFISASLAHRAEARVSRAGLRAGQRDGHADFAQLPRRVSRTVGAAARY